MQCPGQDSRYWDGAAIFESPCSKCGQIMEFFKDDNSRKCSNCGQKVLNPRIDFGCASYCPYAEQCLGELPPELLAKKQDLLIDRTAIEIKRYFVDDFKKISQSLKIARLAAEIDKEEKGNHAVIMTAAYLLHTGSPESPATAAEAARKILTALGANPGLIDEVCDIIIQYHLRQTADTLNLKVVHDAALLAGLDENQAAEAELEPSLLTNTGKAMLTQRRQDAQACSQK